MVTVRARAIPTDFRPLPHTHLLMMSFNHNKKFQFKLPFESNSLTKPLANFLISCTNSSEFPPEDDTSTDGRTAVELAVSIAATRLENEASWFPALYASP